MAYPEIIKLTVLIWGITCVFEELQKPYKLHEIQDSPENSPVVLRIVIDLFRNEHLVCCSPIRQQLEQEQSDKQSPDQHENRDQ